MNIFYGREEQLKELNNRYKSSKKEFGVIYGRRRIGKSYLLQHFMQDKEGIFYQAKNDSIYGNLKSFSYEINKQLNVPTNFVYSTWQEAFDAINAYYKGKRYVLVIDEYPYVVNQDSSFASILQEFIDHSSDNVLLIISGSDVSMLKKEINDHSSPLYKRRTFEIYLKKLTYKETLIFLKDFSDFEKEKYISLMSSYPYYLSAIDHNLSFEENVKKLLFNQYGTFFTLPDQLLSNSTKIQDVYNSILEAISHRMKTNKQISEYIHESEAKVNKYLKTLVMSEIVEKRETFMGNKKTVYYEISDQLLNFWYMFIYKNLEKIKINGDLIYEQEKESIDVFLNHGFEHLCRLYIDQLNMEGKLTCVFDSPKIYKVEKSKLGRSIEIDGLSLSNNKLLVIDCKDKQSKYTKNMFLHLQENVSVFPDKLEKIYYIFSKGGFEKNMTDLKDENINLIDFKSLFV